MLTAIETVWGRINLAAHDHAKDGTRLNVHDAESLIVKFFREEHVMPWPEPDVIEFYANELLAITERDRSTAR